MRSPSRAYQFYRVEKLLLKPGETITTPHEQVLEGTDFDEPPRSTMCITGSSLAGYEHIRLTHEDEKQKPGRAHGTRFERAIYSTEMNAYYDRDNGILIINGPRAAAQTCTTRLHKTRSDVFEVKPLPIDLMSVVEEVNNTRGAWLTGLPVAGNVTSVGLFGDHVDLSADFSKYSALATLSAITVELTFSREQRTFMVTRHGTVVFYGQGDAYKDLMFMRSLYGLLYPDLPGGEQAGLEVAASGDDERSGLFPGFEEARDGS